MTLYQVDKEAWARASDRIDRVIARVMHLFTTTTSEQGLDLGKAARVTKAERPQVGGFAAAALSSEG